MSQPDQSVFREPGYLRHNKARLGHLASLGLPLARKTVLILGAGIGDHVPFFLEQGCGVSITDGRQSNVDWMNREHPEWMAAVLDVEREPLGSSSTWDVIHCYGLLYHCGLPGRAIKNMAKFKPDFLLLETCVQSPAFEELAVSENKDDPRCSLTGEGCRYPRATILKYLTDNFPFAYITATQPNHEEFPCDWNKVVGEARCVFVASRAPLDPDKFLNYVPTYQNRLC